MSSLEQFILASYVDYPVACSEHRICIEYTLLKQARRRSLLAIMASIDERGVGPADENISLSGTTVDLRMWTANVRRLAVRE